MADSADLERQLPIEALVYLDNLGMPLTPEGKRMTFKAAAQMAGVSYSNVWSWRQRHEGFAALEDKARRGRRESQGRRLARHYVYALVTPAGRNLARELERVDGDARLAWDVLRTAAAIADVSEVRTEVVYTAADLARDREQAERELAEWENGQGMESVDTENESPPGSTAAGGV